MNKYGEAYKLVAENSALLSSITELPGKEKECELPAEDGNHQLPVAREMQLADDLAFLSATTDNMYEVKAVGIEEDLDKMGMTIRVASNTGELSRVKDGFQLIGSILQRAASRSKSLLFVARRR